MLPRRYQVLLGIASLVLLMGLGAFIVPETYRGPLLPIAYTTNSLYLADALGYLFIALGVFGLWFVALVWDYRRRHDRPQRPALRR
jgi:hypothetical protein